MYRCEICKQVVSRRTKATRLPVKTRARQYPARQKEVFKRGQSKMITVSGGSGYEIVSEVVACPACAAKFHSESEATPSAV